MTKVFAMSDVLGGTSPSPPSLFLCEYVKYLPGIGVIYKGRIGKRRSRYE